MRLDLIITTHERPDALAAVLASLGRQSRPPDALWIADDGSGPTTAAAVAAHAATATYPVHHLRQAHEGFRVARLRNLALAAADRATPRPDYVVLLDGDMVMHPEFLADHARAARPGHWLQGARVLLDDAATHRVLAGGTPPGPLGTGLGTRRRAYLWRAPRRLPAALSAALSHLGNALLSIKACNQGFWLQDLLATNGYDERIEGWGPEDKELCARLENAGIRRRSLLGGGVAWHLAHPPAPRDRRSVGEAILRDTVRSGRTRSEYGIARKAAW